MSHLPPVKYAASRTTTAFTEPLQISCDVLSVQIWLLSYLQPSKQLGTANSNRVLAQFAHDAENTYLSTNLTVFQMALDKVNLGANGTGVGMAMSDQRHWSGLLEICTTVRYNMCCRRFSGTYALIDTL